MIHLLSWLQIQTKLRLYVAKCELGYNPYVLRVCRIYRDYMKR